MVLTYVQHPPSITPDANLKAPDGPILVESRLARPNPSARDRYEFAPVTIGAWSLIAAGFALSIVCGLRGIGLRIVEQLHRSGETVIGLEEHADSTSPPFSRGGG